MVAGAGEGPDMLPDLATPMIVLLMPPRMFNDATWSKRRSQKPSFKNPEDSSLLASAFRADGLHKT